MNKTIIINISGIIFHIEEDAYEILKGYISQVKLHFSTSADSFEIITDIENRIAELFTEKLAVENKQVVVLADVQEVMAKMGTISDFELNESEQKESTSTYAPSAETEKVKRRLFRDADNKIIGGVAAGLANYLAVDPTWVRLIWALFACTWGIGILAYLILWIVLPTAKTIADKMAVKGEAANLANIKKAVNDKAAEIKNNSQIKTFFNDFFEILGSLIKALAKAIVILLGIVLIITAVVALFGITTGSGIFLGLMSDTHNLQLVDPAYRTGTYLCLFLLLFIPAFMILLLGTRIIFNKMLLNRVASLSLLAIWLCAFAIGGFFVAKTARGFKEEASLRKVIDISPSANNVFYLNADDRKILNHSDSLHFNITIKNGFKVYRYNGFEVVDVDLRIEKSPDTKAHLIKIYKARGTNFDTAIRNAQGIIYNFSQKDSVITFNRNAELQTGSLWRKQEVELILQLPVNSKVVIDQAVEQILRDPYYYECDNSTDKTRTWIMGAEGLKCEEGKSPVHYQHDESDTFDNMLKDIAREAIIKQLSTGNTLITINSDDQTVNFMVDNWYNIRTQITKNKEEITEVYVTIARKPGKASSERDSWEVKSISEPRN
ncbi:PspC domain-containing protein [Solitalea koreensis]|uniref:Phage shock protein C (PspC) family protein n=1 Tax=Solitalea koreensis TaxID=543615 RepID=A0A521C6Q8_9SPHI|nr:PspC domain-containing protein [Solitalea koreensis]SMO55142.1 phage shock protein C (PspC) family protein [Solitalea koreensis]